MICSETVQWTVYSVHSLHLTRTDFELEGIIKQGKIRRNFKPQTKFPSCWQIELIRDQTCMQLTILFDYLLVVFFSLQ